MLPYIAKSTFIAILLSLILISDTSADMKIETIAGTTNSRFIGDGPAFATNVNPVALAVHPKTGDLYFAEPGRDPARGLTRIRVLRDS